MKIKGEIQLEYENSKDAKIVFNSLKIDNKGFLESKIEDKHITYKITTSSLGSFLNTSDDLIASEIVVEKILNTTSNK